MEDIDIIYKMNCIDEKYVLEASYVTKKNRTKPFVKVATILMILCACLISSTTLASISNDPNAYSITMIPFSQLEHFNNITIKEYVDKSHVASIDSTYTTLQRHIYQENDRIYAIYNNKQVDITKAIERNKIKKYRYKDEYGYIYTLYIGGSGETLGWIEFVTQQNGKKLVCYSNLDFDVEWVKEIIDNDNKRK